MKPTPYVTAILTLAALAARADWCDGTRMWVLDMPLHERIAAARAEVRTETANLDQSRRVLHEHLDSRVNGARGRLDEERRRLAERAQAQCAAVRQDPLRVRARVRLDLTRYVALQAADARLRDQLLTQSAVQGRMDRKQAELALLDAELDGLGARLVTGEEAVLLIHQACRLVGESVGLRAEPTPVPLDRLYTEAIQQVDGALDQGDVDRFLADCDLSRLDLDLGPQSAGPPARPWWRPW